MKKIGGYTLVELAGVLAIAGTVTAVALPALGTLVGDAQRTAVVNQLVATLLVARSEALKRGGRPLVACGVSDRDDDGAFDATELSCAGQNWSEGWALGTWDDANGNARVDPDEFQPVRVFQTGTAARLSVTAGNFMASPPVGPAGTLLIKSFGRRTSNGTITVCDRAGAVAPRAVIVSPVGRPRVAATRADGTPLGCP